MRNLIIALVALTTLMVSCTPSKTVSSSKKKVDKSLYNKQVVFDEDTKFANLLSQAQAEGKPVFIDFYTDWCSPCKWLDQDVFNTEYAAVYFNKNMINIKVNAEKGQGIALAAQYGVTAYPTIIYADYEGNEIRRHVGLTTATKAVDMAKDAVETTKRKQERNTGR